MENKDLIKLGTVNPQKMAFKGAQHTQTATQPVITDNLVASE